MRFHPFARLLICALGLLLAAVLMSAMLFAGNALATQWTGKPPTEPLEVVVARYVLPLTLLTYPACLLWLAYCRTSLDKRSLASLGLRARRLIPDFVRGALTGALAITLLWLVLWLTGAISVVGWAPETFDNNPLYSLVILAGYAMAFLAVGFIEEAYFRGYALHNLNQWLGWPRAVAVQALFFALVHLQNVFTGNAAEKWAALGAMPGLVLIAIFFALCYRKTGSLWFPIGFHAAWNFFLGCVFSLPVSGISTYRLFDIEINANSWISGGSFGAEGSWLLLPILGALIFYMACEPDHPQTILDLNLLSAPIAEPAPIIEEETEEEPRESRYKTKFGTATGFDTETLRSLRDIQEKRRREQEERKKVALLAAQESERVAALAPQVEESPSQVEESPTPVEESPTQVEESPTPVEELPTPKPKKPAPRW